MKISRFISRFRRDFTAEYVCQHCGARRIASGYDDAYFHEFVIPNMKCFSCQKTGDEVTSSPMVPPNVIL